MRGLAFSELDRLRSHRHRDRAVGSGPVAQLAAGVLPPALDAAPCHQGAGVVSAGADLGAPEMPATVTGVVTTFLRNSGHPFTPDGGDMPAVGMSRTSSIRHRLSPRSTFALRIEIRDEASERVKPNRRSLWVRPRALPVYESM